jgi:hypothetical protein
MSETPISFAPEVIADNSGKWCGNACRYATEAEAEAAVNNLMMRWTLVRDTRVVPSNDPVNYRWDTAAGSVPIAAPSVTKAAIDA